MKADTSGMVSWGLEGRHDLCLTQGTLWRTKSHLPIQDLGIVLLEFKGPEI